MGEDRFPHLLTDMLDDISRSRDDLSLDLDAADWHRRTIMISKVERQSLGKVDRE